MVVAVADDLMPLPLSCCWLQIVDWFVVVAVATDWMPLPLSLGGVLKKCDFFLLRKKGANSG